MEIKLIFGGVLFLIKTERAVIINEELFPFLSNMQGDPDIIIEVSWNWKNAKFPETEPVGQDLIQNYYVEKDICFCVTRAGKKGPIASTCYTPDFRKVICTLNTAPFLEPPERLESIIRMLPMREIFQYFHTLFLHASQISYKGKGVLFAAPSGGGKSTQAKLWNKYRNAEIICSDRTLIRKRKDEWYTYGYPLDGSEPIRSNKITSLGCVVLLKTGTENFIQELTAGKAITLMMRQVVMDCWSGKARQKAMELIISLLEDIPVFLLVCTPDEYAVKTLEKELIEKGVIPNGDGY